MGWVFFPVRIAVVTVCALALALAAAIFLARPDRVQNRRLALLLLLESALFGCGEGLMYLTDVPAETFAYQALAYACGAAVPFLFLRFYATLDNPVSRVLARRPVDALLVACAAMFPIHVLLDTPRYVSAVVPATDGTAVWDIVWGDLTFYVFFAYLIVVLLGFVLAGLTLREAREGLARRQARLYFAGFGARDALLVLVLIPFLTGFEWPFASAWLGVLGYLLFVPILSYAILRAQLFDIDLRIKWTIRRGTLVGIFAVAFVVVAEVAQNWLSDAFGYLAGGLAAGALLLALRPLDRLSERVADTAMPRVEDTPAYVTYRKMEVYRAAVEAARQDGVVSDKERAVLASLRASLAIPEADAAALERDVASSAAAPP